MIKKLQIKKMNEISKRIIKIITLVKLLSIKFKSFKKR